MYASTTTIDNNQKVDPATAVGVAVMIDVRQTVIEELIQAIQDNQVLCLQGAHGVGKKHVLTKALESIGSIIKFEATLPVTYALEMFKADLRNLYRETEHDTLHVLLLDVTKMLTFPVVGEYDSGLRQQVENRKQQFEGVLQFLKSKAQSSEYNLSTLKVVFTSCIDIPDELAEEIAVIKLPVYSGSEKAVIYGQHFPKATPQQISEHVLFHAEHPGIQKGPLKKLVKEPLEECRTPGTANIVGVFSIDGKTTRDGEIIQHEALFLPRVNALITLKK